MTASPKKQLALDAHLLLDLAEGKDFAHEFRGEFQACDYEFLLPPTAAAQLNALIQSRSPPASFRDSLLQSFPDHASPPQPRCPNNTTPEDSESHTRSAPP